MSEIKFKITSIGLDASNLNYTPEDLGVVYDYIHTDISKNNSYKLREAVDFGKSNLYTTIDFLDGVEQAVEGHLIELRARQIDVLLIDACCDIKKYLDNINDLLRAGLVSRVGISNPKTIGDLEKIKKIIEFDSISLEIHPLNFNFDIINWANENNIKIIGFNSFGGHVRASNMIDSMTIPYLLNFSAIHADTVFLSSSDLSYSAINANYLIDLIGKSVNIPDEDDNIYLFSKNVLRETLPKKNLIHTSIKIDNAVLPVINPKLVFPFEELVFASKDYVVNIPEITSENPLVTFVNDYIKSIHLSEDASIGGQLALIRYGVISLIRIKSVNCNVDITETKFADNAVSYRIMTSTEKKKGWFRTERIDTSTDYILYFYNGVGYFNEILDESEKDSNSEEKGQYS